MNTKSASCSQQNTPIRQSSQPLYNVRNGKGEGGGGGEGAEQASFKGPGANREK